MIKADVGMPFSQLEIMEILQPSFESNSNNMNPEVATRILSSLFHLQSSYLIVVKYLGVPLSPGSPT